eukprot:TRINITY_DN3123_c0_g1_i1.p1 TRINITY_DN3123_c0_g1~~TRINITY_DN3123_c0_g1_i1.p1  ORF type:complete len:793 (+),score=321.77 TRINITY_DN3123_c0_g1_i1:52-2430(+)
MKRAALVLAAALVAHGDVVGYWNWNWGGGSVGPEGATMALSFTGLIDPAAALAQGRPPVAGLTNILSIGGGNAAGMFSEAALKKIDPPFLAQAKAAGYTGVAYDIEECAGGATPPEAFAASFKVVKAAGLNVLVTVSHTAPYACTNKVALMDAFIADTNVDYMSPQLYSSGTEAAPSFDWDGTPFKAFRGMAPHMKMVPSVVDATHYPAVRAFFANNSIPLHGFIQWRQEPAAETAVVAADAQWYPDWSTNKCVTGTPPSYQQTVPTKAACCQKWFSWDPTCDVTPAPPVPPTPPTPVPSEVVAYWDWTWGSGSKGPAGANIAISFSGWASVNEALAESQVYAGIPTYLDIGGGNGNGRWTTKQLATLDGTFLGKVVAAGYKGISFDIEECGDVIAPAQFAAVFAASKAAGLQNLVTMSHSVPYGCKNGNDLVREWIQDANVDIISPQLYTSGNEAHPDYTAVGVQWKEFIARPASQRFAPSIPNAKQYDEMKAHFAKLGLTSDGFIQWQQVAKTAVVAADAQWYPDWSTNKCVTGTPPSYQQTVPTKAACCQKWFSWDPTCDVTPAPPVPPTPPTPVPSEVVAYWDWTWGSGSKGPAGANIAISFSGWASVNEALAESQVYAGIPTYLDIGGGNGNGRWTTKQLATLDGTFLGKVVAAGYKGISFDIEECGDVIAPAQFAAVFAASKAAGLQNLVTMSHSVPYGCKNGNDLVREWIQDANVDIISPQLYTSGNEAHPDYTAVGVQWKEFIARPASQRFAPSIPNAKQYDEMKAHFAKLGLTSDGFIQWQQQ